MEIYSHSNDAAWQEILFIVSKHYVPLKVNVYFSCRAESTRPLRDRDKARWMKMKFFYIYILNTVGGVTLVIVCLSILKRRYRSPLTYFFLFFFFRKPSTPALSVSVRLGDYFREFISLMARQNLIGSSVVIGEGNPNKDSPPCINISLELSRFDHAEMSIRAFA